MGTLKDWKDKLKVKIQHKLNKDITNLKDIATLIVFSWKYSYPVHYHWLCTSVTRNDSESFNWRFPSRHVFNYVKYSIRFRFNIVFLHKTLFRWKKAPQVDGIGSLGMWWMKPRLSNLCFWDWSLALCSSKAEILCTVFNAFFTWYALDYIKIRVKYLMFFGGGL